MPERTEIKRQGIPISPTDLWVLGARTWLSSSACIAPDGNALRSATLATSGVRHGDLLVLTRPHDIGGFGGDDSNPMAFHQDGSPANPVVRRPHRFRALWLYCESQERSGMGFMPLWP